MNRLPPRNAAIKALVTYGTITELRQIIDHIPRFVIVSHLRINYKRLDFLFNNPQELTFKELARIGELFELDILVMCKLVMKQHTGNDKRQYLKTGYF